VSVVLLIRTTFCVVLFCVICVFCILVVLVRLSVPVQVIDWKDSSPKWPIMCWWGRQTLLTHSLTHPRVDIQIQDYNQWTSGCSSWHYWSDDEWWLHSIHHHSSNSLSSFTIQPHTHTTRNAWLIQRYEYLIFTFLSIYPAGCALSEIRRHSYLATADTINALNFWQFEAAYGCFWIHFLRENQRFSWQNQAGLKLPQ